MSAREPGVWDEGMGSDREEAHYEDLCEYAQAVLDNPEHPHRDDFGGYARETIGGLLKWIERLESRLSVSCQRNATRIATLNSENATMRTALKEITEWSQPDDCVDCGARNIDPKEWCWWCIARNALPASAPEVKS